MTNVESVLHALAGGSETAVTVMALTGLTRPQVSTALQTLMAKRIVKSTGICQHRLARYTLAVTVDDAKRILRPAKPTAVALAQAWPMPVSFPPLVCRGKSGHAER